MAELIKVAYDIDDCMMPFNQHFLLWLTANSQVELGGVGNQNAYKYGEKYPDAIDHLTGKSPDFAGLIGRFTLEASVDVMTPAPWLIEHLEATAGIIKPVAITARPYEHHQVTKELLIRQLGEYFVDLDEVSMTSQLYMPDKDYPHHSAPSKVVLSMSMGASAIIDDAAHNLHQPTANIEDDFTTDIVKFMYRDRGTYWNHNASVDGVHIVNGWREAHLAIDKFVVNNAK